jgi:hypothetical protein
MLTYAQIALSNPGPNVGTVLATGTLAGSLATSIRR